MKKNRNVILFALILALLFYCLDYFFRISQSIIVYPLMHQYHISPLGIGGFASAFYFSYMLLQIPSGILFDYFDFRYVFSISIFVCIIAFVGFVFSNHYWLGILFRIFIGAASASSFIGVLFLAKHYFSSQQFSFIAGIAIGLGTLSASGIQIVGVWIMHYFSWHKTLMGFAFVGLLIGFCFFLFKTPKEHYKIKQKSSLHDMLTLLKNPTLVINAIIASLFYLPTTIFASLWGVSFLQQHYMQSKTVGSTAIMFLFLGWAIGSPIVGFITEKMKNYYNLIRLSALAGVIVSLLLVYMVHLNIITIFILLFLFGLFSSAQVVVWKAFYDHCPQEINGIGVSFVNMVIMLGGAMFHIVVGYLLSWGIFNKADGHIDYQLGLSILPLSFLLVSGVVSLLKICK